MIQVKYSLNAIDNHFPRAHYGYYARKTRCMKMRLMTERRMTSAEMKIWAAVATEMFVRCVFQIRRIVQAVVRAIQKPNRIPLSRSFFPLLLSTCNVVMWIAASKMKRMRKTKVDRKEIWWAFRPTTRL